MAAAAVGYLAVVAGDAPRARHEEPCLIACSDFGVGGGNTVVVVWCQRGSAVAILKKDNTREGEKGVGFTVIMKFGELSLASAERMWEVADLMVSFPEETPVVVLSAMGKTTNNLLLAGEKAVSCGAPKVSEIKELHLRRSMSLDWRDQLF